MSWASDGTQTGTDTDISGIGAVTGVTLYTIGTGTNVRRVAKVTVNLTIDGTLTIDPEHEELVFPNYDVGITVNGTLNIGKKITLGGVDRYSYGTAIHHGRPTTWNDTPYLLDVQNGGTLNWYGGVIYTGGKSLMYRNGSTVKVYSQNAIFVRTQDAANAEAQVRMETNNYDQDGFTDVGYQDTQDWLAHVGFWNTFKGYKPIHKKSALSPSSFSSSSLYIAEDYDASGGNVYDNLFWKNRRMRFKNSVTGSDLNLVGLDANNASNTGVFEVTCDLSVTLLDTSQNAIQGGMVYFKDYDNGDRKNDTVSGANTNYVDDREYVATTDATGKASITDVLTMAVVRDTGGVQGTPDSGYNKYDYRSKNNDNTDVFDFGIHAYGFLKVATINLPLKGAGGIGYERTLIADFSISESNKTTVAGYTTLSTLDQVYDRASYWHLEDSTGKNIAIPSYGEFLVKASGSFLDMGAADVVIDPNASSVFAYDSATSTITIKPPTTGIGAGTKFSGIKTTGTITAKCPVDGISFDGDTYYNYDGSVSDVSVTGDLHVNTGADSTLTFDNVTVTGQVWNDASANTLTINATNGSSLTAGDAGTGAGETNIQNSVTITVTVKDLSTKNPIQGARVYLERDSDGAQIINDVTDANGQVSTTYNYTTDTAVSGHARKASSSPYYKAADITGTITSAGFTTTILMIKDE